MNKLIQLRGLVIVVVEGGDDGKALVGTLVYVTNFDEGLVDLLACQ